MLYMCVCVCTISEINSSYGLNKKIIKIRKMSGAYMRNTQFSDNFQTIFRLLKCENFSEGILEIPNQQKVSFTNK